MYYKLAIVGRDPEKDDQIIEVLYESYHKTLKEVKRQVDKWIIQGKKYEDFDLTRHNERGYCGTLDPYSLTDTGF